MQKPPMASAPPAEFNVQSPAPTAGYQTPGHPAPNPGAGGFTPRMGEGQTAARGRVIDQVLSIVTRNGQSPSDNG